MSWRPPCYLNGGLNPLPALSAKASTKDRMPSASPTDTTIRRLFAVSMNRCAFPGCTTPVIDSIANTIFAEVCHIRARNPRGPRFDSQQTDGERHGFDNLLLMCGVHHKLIDAPENLARFTPEELLRLKAQHESDARSNELFTKIELSDVQLSALQSAVEQYESGAVHNDFRHASFRVGGEGGHWGGGGGGGGILTIVGTTKLPTQVALGAQAGQAPGGGGGGAGGVQFVGRPVDNDDLAAGVALSAVFLANATSFSSTLINVLGGGWSFVEVSPLPARIRILLVLIFDFGAIEPSTLLRINVEVVRPHGVIAFEDLFDIEVPECRDLVKRTSQARLLDIDVAEHGVWQVIVRSSTHRLGVHCFECRAKGGA